MFQNLNYKLQRLKRYPIIDNVPVDYSDNEGVIPVLILASYTGDLFITPLLSRVYRAPPFFIVCVLVMCLLVVSLFFV